ncbi:Eco57I restriction-modification methylase domain-containing protein [Streptococcus parauberis]|uniref:Eco57I restriction-modification methylase domain-containing protein n=1 Tax=Streptococcus parauberis TaxID=1348 RepID=UPI00288DEE95|nr:Eco57I restriction-modification methylase domain-containing protein [Streptococcus parauberis]MDT2750236.1 Eco57I restriction-modification methylase domain-containing protein [Streptococcus parauberis]
MNLISEVLINTRNFLLSQTKDTRKKIGQFFTDEQTALYMANMFDLSNYKGKIRVLDPGTGTGILSAAFIEIAIKQNISNIDLVLVENNLDVLPVLKENIKLFKSLKNIKISVTLIEENFITFQSNSFRKKTPSRLGQFDYIICNPPYLKIPRNSEETINMDEVISGAPNLYFLFMALSIHNLFDNGEMVYIIPRSWTSGAYFKKFRNYIFDSASLSQVHLFARRDKVFSIEKVLQETIIVKFIKSKMTDIVTLTSSEDNTFSNVITHQSSQKVLVQGSSKYVFLPTSSEEIQLLQRIGKFNNTLPKLGMRLKTGLTVDFKNRNRLKNQAEKGTVPLLFPFNIDNGRINFPNKNKGSVAKFSKKSILV